ncbi:MAG: M23 family metallopeptidase [Deltaproteobacteria bacterium]|nr:M23 family metallopeptidase [Deltaproteobacteria bacterium]MBW2218250.1 M23 family metallopeptidase [Deltaproteobacteria bacterium]
MRNKITFVVFGNTGSRIHQATISKPAVITSFIFIALFLISFATVGYQHYDLKRNISDAKLLQAKINGQEDEIAGQHQQIQIFANEINFLKGKLVELNGFEKKIRIIANIEHASENENLFGVGGTSPEDLDTRISTREKHNGLVREMHEQVKNLEFASNQQKHGFNSLLIDLEAKRNLLASTPSIIPTSGWISSRFGRRKSPFTGLTELHKGLDIASREGTPIIATADGIVTFAAKKGLLGKVVVIDHGHGISTRYGHCGKLLKSSGEAVKRGDVIAHMGNTGRSTGPHLHYEVKLNGIQVNPEKYMFNIYSLKVLDSAG